MRYTLHKIQSKIKKNKELFLLITLILLTIVSTQIYNLNKDKIKATWKYVKTLIRRDKSIKETVQIESDSKSNKLNKII